MTTYIFSPSDASDITSVLRRRGLEPTMTGTIQDTLFPGERLKEIIDTHGYEKYDEYFSKGPPITPYLNYFGQNEFRKMVRRLLRDGRPPVPLAELSSLAGSRTGEYLQFLERLLVLEKDDDTAKLTRNINNLGASLEHYVASICTRELRGSAEWGVHIGNLPRSDSGGDFDVLAWLEPSLVYIECKTSPPSNIEESQIREFLQRGFELAPDLAILLIDTEDDLTPFVNDRVNPIMREALGIEDAFYQAIREHPDYPRVFYGFYRFYITNTRKTILTQLQRCLQHYYAHMKPVSEGYGGRIRSVNFTRKAIQDD